MRNQVCSLDLMRQWRWRKTMSRQMHLLDLTCLTKKQFQERRILQMY